MSLAVEEAKKEETPILTKIAETFGVTRKALSDRYHGKIDLNAAPGKKPYLTDVEEDILVQFLIDVSGLGFGYDVQSLKQLIQKLLNKDGNDLTRGWVQYFMKKHPVISVRRTEAFDRLRSRNVDRDLISYYFELLDTAFEKVRVLSNGVALTPERIYCMDETGLYLNRFSRYVIAEKGAQNVFSVTSESREHTTIICYASAAGLCGSPYFITPKQIQGFLGNRFPGAQVGVTKSGYINNSLFEDWIEFFIRDIRTSRGDPNHWCLLIVDGHPTHTLNDVALRTLNDAHIMAISLPSHTTSLLQVHDLAIFKPLKTYFSAAMSQYVR